MLYTLIHHENESYFCDQSLNINQWISNKDPIFKKYQPFITDFICFHGELTSGYIDLLRRSIGIRKVYKKKIIDDESNRLVMLYFR